MADGKAKELKMGVDYLENMLGDYPGPQALIESVNNSASLIPTMLEGVIPDSGTDIKDAVGNNRLLDKTQTGTTASWPRKTAISDHIMNRTRELAKEMLAKTPMQYASGPTLIPSSKSFAKKNKYSQGFSSNGVAMGPGYTNLKPLTPYPSGWSGSPVLSPKINEEQTITLTLEPVPYSNVSVGMGNQDLLRKNILNQDMALRQNVVKQEQKKYLENWRKEKFPSFIPPFSTNKLHNNTSQMIYSNEVPRHAVVGRKITEVFLESKYPASKALSHVARSTHLKNTLKRKHHDVSDVFVRYLNRPKWARHDPHVMMCKSELSTVEHSSPSVLNNSRNGVIPWPSDKVPLSGYVQVEEKTKLKPSTTPCRFKTRNLSKYRIARPKRIHFAANTTSKLQMKNGRPVFNIPPNLGIKINQFIATDRLTWDSKAKKFAFPSSMMAKSRLPKTSCFSFPTAKFSKPFNSVPNYRILHKPKATNRFIPSAQRPRPAFSQTVKSTTNKVSIQPQKLSNLNEILKCTSVPEPAEFGGVQDYFNAVALYQAKNLLIARALTRGQCVSDEHDPKKVETGDKVVGKLCSIVDMLSSKHNVCPCSFVLLNAHTEEVLKSWEASLHLHKEEQCSVKKENELEKEVEPEKSAQTTREKIQWFYNSDISPSTVPGNNELEPNDSSSTSYQVRLAWQLDEVHEDDSKDTPASFMLPALSPQRVLNYEVLNFAENKDLESVDMNHNRPASHAIKDSKPRTRTPYCQRKVTLLHKKMGCMCKQKRLKPPPSYCVRFRGRFCLPDCCPDKSLWVNCMRYVRGDACIKCANSSNRITQVESTDIFVKKIGDVGHYNSMNGTVGYEWNCSENDSIKADNNTNQNGNVENTTRLYEDQSVSGEKRSPVNKTNSDRVILDSSNATLSSCTDEDNVCVLGEDMDTEFFKMYGKSLEDLAKIAWEDGSFSTLNHIPEKGETIVESSRKDVKISGENPKDTPGTTENNTIDCCEEKMHDKVVDLDSVACERSRGEKEERGSASINTHDRGDIKDTDESCHKHEEIARRGDLNLQTGEILIGCDENTDEKHVGGAQAERNLDDNLSSRTIASQTGKTKHNTEIIGLEDSNTQTDRICGTKELRNKVNSTTKQEEIKKSVSYNVKMGRGSAKDPLDMEYSLEEVNKCSFPRKDRNNFISQEGNELASVDEPEDLSNHQSGITDKKDGEGWSSVRLRSKRAATKRGRYEDDYVTDLPKNSKKAKKTMPCRDYNEEKFWNFYRQSQRNEHSKNLVLRHRYIKFFMQNDINCKTLSLNLASNSFTCAAPSLQYANTNQPKSVVPESGFLPFMRTFTKTKKIADPPLKATKDNKCPYCGRFFTKEPRSVLDAHMARHEMGQWKVLAAPKPVVRKKKKKHQRKAPVTNNKSIISSQSTVVFVNHAKNSKKDGRVGNTVNSKDVSARGPFIPTSTTSTSSCGSSELEKLKTIKAFPRPSNISMGHRKQTARKSFSNLARNLSKENLIAALTASSNTGKLQSVSFKTSLHTPGTDPARKFLRNNLVSKISGDVDLKRNPEELIKEPLSSVNKLSYDGFEAHTGGPSEVNDVVKPLQKHHHHKRRTIGLSKYANSVDSSASN